jgi:hypothetical protein
MRGRIALPKHFVRDSCQTFARLRGVFGVRTRPRVAFPRQ